MLSQLLQHQMMGGGLVSYWMKHEEWKERMCSPATLSVCSNPSLLGYRVFKSLSTYFTTDPPPSLANSTAERVLMSQRIFFFLFFLIMCIFPICIDPTATTATIMYGQKAVFQGVKSVRPRSCMYLPFSVRM